MKYIRLIFFSAVILHSSGCRKTSQLWLDELSIQKYSEGISTVAVTKAGSGDSINIGSVSFKRGIGIRYISVITFFTDGKAIRFKSDVGLADRPADANPVKFYVLGDRKVLFESTVIKAGEEPEKIDLNIKGIKQLGLLIINTVAGGNRALAYWADSRFIMYGDNIPRLQPDTGERYILTPLASPKPAINSPGVFGATPGNPVLYTIAASGKRPMIFSAEALPRGLLLDPETGFITGKIYRKGEYIVNLRAKNEFGQAWGKLKIVIGDTIALTPPMGWNGWNAWVKEIDRSKVIASVDAMVSTGLKDHGWMYINIDDTWEGKRGGKYHAIQPNEKFPDFQGMVNYIHAQGLKVGVYSTPWICTYQGYPGTSSENKDGDFADSIMKNRSAFHYIGKYRFEVNDVRQMAAWGIDYLKYDWHIRYPSEAESMSAALRSSGRDIVYSLSNSAPFEYAKKWGWIANLYRTGSDIRDSWISLYSAAFTIDKWGPFDGPGHWNDPDMMVLGNISTGAPLHPTRLTPDEQYTHMSIFCLLAAPLIIGCPVEELDPFTLNLLTNDEVLEIDQDPLGKSGRLVVNDDGIEIWKKPMEDGSFAVGIFYTGDFGSSPQSYFRWGDETAKNYTLDLSSIGLTGKWNLRDVWRQKDLGESDSSFTTSIPFHGVVLLRISRGKIGGH